MPSSATNALSAPPPPTSPSSMKLALVANDGFSLYHFRLGLIETLRDAGHDVCVIVPRDDYAERILATGVRVEFLPVARFTDPVSDLVYMARLARIFRRERFDLIHTMTVKPNIFGTLASLVYPRSRRVALVSGAGYLFMDQPNRSGRVVAAIGRALYRVAFRFVHRCWFQNPDDLDEFVDRGIIDRKRSVVILGSGVNLERFSTRMLPDSERLKVAEELGLAPDERFCLMVAARLIRSKGVLDLADAARRLAEQGVDLPFVLLAPPDPTATDAVTPEEVRRAAGGARFHLLTDFEPRVERLMAVARMIVLPSYYREGVPRSLLEGMAMSLPVVTNDNTGCREVVDDGENGYLVPVRDPEALADRIGRVATDDELARRMGAASRTMVEERFSERAVVRNVRSQLYGEDLERGE